MYSVAYFKNIKQNGVSLNSKAKKIIDELNSKVSSPNYKKNPNFKRRKRNQNMDWEAMRNFKKNNIISLHKDNFHKIKSEFNKMTKSNYSKKELIILGLIKTANETNVYQKISDLLFELSTNNIYFCDLFSKFYANNLFNKNVILDNKIEEYINLVDNIKMCKFTGENYQEFCDENKKKDKRMAMSKFIIELAKYGIIDANTIVDIIKNNLNKINKYINEEDKLDIVEELAEISCILVFDGKMVLKEIKDWNDIINNIIKMSELKAREYPSLSNKILFKLQEKIEKM